MLKMSLKLFVKSLSFRDGSQVRSQDGQFPHLLRGLLTPCHCFSLKVLRERPSKKVSNHFEPYVHNSPLEAHKVVQTCWDCVEAHEWHMNGIGHTVKQVNTEYGATKVIQ